MTEKYFKKFLTEETFQSTEIDNIKIKVYFAYPKVAVILDGDEMYFTPEYFIKFAKFVESVSHELYNTHPDVFKSENLRGD